MPAPERASGPSIPVPAYHARVLVVDDRRENLTATAAVLEPLEAELTFASSGEEALRQVLQHDFAVVLMDVQMPGMDGFEAAQLIRARERSRAVPIIFVTAIDREHRRELAGYAAGAVDFLYKPLDPDILRSKVATFLEIDRLRSESQLVARLRESERRAAAIVETALDCVVSIDHLGRIIEFNPAAERTFGYAREQVIGRPMSDYIVPPEHREAHRGGMERYARTGEAHILGQRLELPAMRADGSTFESELTILRMPGEGPATFTAFLRDVTEVRRAAERTRRIHEATAALSSALTPDEVAAVIVDHCVAALGASAGSVYRLSDDGEALEYLQSVGYPEDMIGRWRSIPIQQRLPLAEAARTNTAVFIASPKEWASRFDDAGPLRGLPGSAAWVAVPLVVQDRVLGAMGLSFAGDGGPPPLDEQSRKFVLGLAHQCAQALERARLHAAEHQARVEAEDARSAAELANRAKGDFLATMSHELRTPLNAIQGYAQLLEVGVAGEMTEKQRDFIGRIKNSGAHLLGLINDILDISRAEARALKIEMERGTTGPVVASAIALTTPQAVARGLQVTTLQETEAGVPYLGDERRVLQILVNLLSNSIKFTDAGGTITVSARVERVGAAESWAVLTVTDSGIGIPAEQSQRVFEPFHQVESGRTRRAGGTGLGLSISRQLARLMGGDLTVESEPGRGSTFTLRLTAPDAPGGTASPTAPASDSA